MDPTAVRNLSSPFFEKGHGFFIIEANPGPFHDLQGRVMECSKLAVREPTIIGRFQVDRV